MHAVDPFRGRVRFRRDPQPVAHLDALEHEHLVLDDHFAGGLDLVVLALDLDSTRLQRAREGAGQSAGRGGDDVVERRRVGRELGGIGAVVLGDLRVHPEGDRLRLGREVGEPLRPTEALDADVRSVDDFAHVAVLPKPALSHAEASARRRLPSCTSERWSRAIGTTRRGEHSGSA